jgi:diguanylate cyclase (GGDEF)-like protein
VHDYGLVADGVRPGPVLLGPRFHAVAAPDLPADELLAGTAERIRCAVDGRATVARLGGDEFAVLIPQASAAGAEAAARAVRDSFAAPLDLSCGPVPRNGSVGLAVAEPGETPEPVIAKADAAMYREKSVRRRPAARRARAATVRSAHSPVS